jgi:hypothetical protein
MSEVPSLFGYDLYWKYNVYITWFMDTDALQHRKSIGRFHCLARTVKNSKHLTLLEFIGIYLYFAAIRSNFGVILWIFKWRKETELCIKLLTVVEVELILPKLLDKSESEGPGFISIPDIISKIDSWVLTRYNTERASVGSIV